MSLEEKVELEPEPPKFKPYSERSDLELFGGVYNAIKNKTMNYGTLEAEILELIEALKKDPVIRRNLQHYNKTNAQLNYYSSDLVADLMQIGFVEHWCLHPETLEFVYRHKHYYLISSDDCVNHDRMDIWKTLFNNPRIDPECVNLYKTETPLKRKFEICDEHKLFKTIAPSCYDSTEDCLKVVAYYTQNLYLCINQSAWSPKYNDNIVINDYLKSRIKDTLGFHLNDVVEHDNLELFKYIESIYTKNQLYFKFRECVSSEVSMGVNIASYLGGTDVRILINNLGRRIRLTKAAFEAIGIPFISKADVTDDINAWWHSIHIPDLNLRQEYYRRIYMHVAKQNNTKSIKQLIGSKIAMEYFVSDSKTAIESKTEMTEVYLTIQKHPIMLKQYLSLGLTPDFAISDVHIRSVVARRMHTDLMRRIYKLGFGKILLKSVSIQHNGDVKDIAFLCLIIDPNLINLFTRNLLDRRPFRELANHLEKHIKSEFYPSIN